MFENPFVKSADDLVTTHEARRAGFLDAVLRRSKEEAPYLERAKALFANIKSKTKKCSEVIRLKGLQDALLDAAGVSKKARNCLGGKDKKKLLSEFFKKVIAPTGDNYAEEIVYRYLMSLGEQLGGRMRNLIGKAAQGRFTQSIIAQLQLIGADFSFHGKSGKWMPSTSYDFSAAEGIRAIRWTTGGYNRTLVYNLTVPGIGGRNKNVDIVVLNISLDSLTTEALKKAMADAKTLHLMGELKGGIDPAGGDEHWKTARGALERIREAYKKAYVVYAGAAIEKSMSKEIFTQLQVGQLDYAANITNADQLAALCAWVVEQ